MFVGNSMRFISPTICSNPQEPLQHSSTPSPNKKMTIALDIEDDVSLDLVLDKYKFSLRTPDVIESDYWGQCQYTRGPSVHIHCIVSNALHDIRDMSMGGDTLYQFDGKVGRAYNEMVTGMIYQWKGGCLESFATMIRQGNCSDVDVHE